MKKPIPVREFARPTFRPALEPLESRLTPSTYTVSSLADSGEGSLRAAITSVNADTTPDEIDFSVAGVIQLTSGALPAISNTVKINGRSAPGFASAPVVEIDFNSFDGLTINAANSVLAALSLVNSGHAGVTFAGADNSTVVGNYIGLALDGSALPNKGNGLSVDNSKDALIGGTTTLDRNVISGNGTTLSGGIMLGPNGFDQNATIEGNIIGADPSGQPVLPAQWAGILIVSNGNTVGGLEAGAGNVIADNNYGIYVSAGTGNAFLGNSISNGVGVVFQNNGNDNQQPPPLLFTAQAGAATKIAGIVNGDANAAYTIQVFVSFNGQGQTLLGTLTATTNASGFALFTFTAQVPANAGFLISALATSPSRNTSNFGIALGQFAANQAYVAGAYGLLLQRTPDGLAEGWRALLDKGASPAEVVLGIESSDEYLKDQVAAMYSRYLQRQADSDGADYWVHFLKAGGTLEQVAEELTSSQEYFVLQGGTNQGFITGLYQEVLNRNPSAAEVAGWLAALESGTSRHDVSVAFLTSQEYRTDLVQADYMMFLLRPADSAGLATWVNALKAGATDQQVLAQIFGSPEGYQVWS